MVGAIIPWNYPIDLVVLKVAPALCAGCCVVVKPSEETPLSALFFAHLIEQVGKLRIIVHFFMDIYITYELGHREWL